MQDINSAPQLIKDFLNYLETIKGKSSNTIKEYYFDLRTFFRFIKLHYSLESKDVEFDNISISNIDIDIIDKITLSDLYEYMSFVNRNRGNSARSRARKVASLKSFFNFLNNKAKVTKNNPTKDLESPKIQKSIPKYLTLEESMRLLDSIDGKFKTRDYAIITLFLNCGLRLSELVSININNIKKDTLTVIGKGNKERTIYLNDACLFAINNYLKDRPNKGLKDKNALFLSARKQRISPKTVQYIVKKNITTSGLDVEKFSTHKLRHTAATLMYKHGNVDIRALQEILGHENLATTEIYTHIDSEQLRNAVSKNPLGKIKKRVDT